MIDALLYAIRDALHNAGFGYSIPTCDIMPTGEPPPRCGDFFLAIHQGNATNERMDYLDEYFDWSLTLTMRVTVPIEMIGNKLLASQLARKPGPNGQPSFNARSDQLRALMHMNWEVLGMANTRIVNMEPDMNTIEGFAEPAHYASREIPILVGGEWFTGMPEAQDVGLKSEIRFVKCRRFQPIATFV